MGPLLFQLFVSLRKFSIFAIHEIRPVDGRHKNGLVITTIQNFLVKQSSGILTFSRLSKELAEVRFSNTRVFSVDLIPETRSYRRYQFSEKRQDFAIIGRYSEYKGIEFALSIWSQFCDKHQSEDILDLWLSGSRDLQVSLPRVRIRSRDMFEANDLDKAIVNYKAVLLPYRKVSQSGVQLLAQSAGVHCMVSSVLGLEQYQPDNSPGLDFHDESDWINALIHISDNQVAVEMGHLSQMAFLNRIKSPMLCSVFSSLLSDSKGKL